MGRVRMNGPCGRTGHWEQVGPFGSNGPQTLSAAHWWHKMHRIYRAEALEQRRNHARMVA
jgi:hypothetical protein